MSWNFVELIYFVEFIIEDVVYFRVFQDVILLVLQPLLSLHFVVKLLLLLLLPRLLTALLSIFVVVLRETLLFRRLSFSRNRSFGRGGCVS